MGLPPHSTLNLCNGAGPMDDKLWCAPKANHLSLYCWGNRMWRPTATILCCPDTKIQKTDISPQGTTKSVLLVPPLKLKSNRKGRRANQQEAFFKYLWVMLSPSRQFPRLLCCNNNKLIFHFLSLVIIMTSLRVSEPPPQGLAGSGGELPPSSLQTERYEESSPLHFDPLFQALKNVYSVVLHP